MRATTPTLSFTLVEMLVVLAIVGILMALLLPTLAMVRERARAMSCRSNLHQLGMAMQLYVDDHNEQFPYDVRPRFAPSVIEDPPVPWGPMRHEDPTDPDSNRWDGAPMIGLLAPYLQGAEDVWYCPDVDRDAPEIGEGTNYEVNACLVVNTLPMWGRPRRGAVSLSSVRNPEKVLVFQDHYTQGRIAHNDGRNFVCVAGNVIWQRHGTKVVRAGWWW
jgi:prepilin-type N-terminal cleavage/methylation domain-containing protein